jgi:hypothetical protein
VVARNVSLHPGKSYTTYLFHERPADISEEVRLTLPASKLGGTDVVRLRVPLSN